ncbi:hypothetical protein BDV38DRAFT_260411 [Aspergillus pseudotamarii]|uniref:Uncharacterized protein n=1 Tax=Aspergillus pseudotamarii TaxID=132259 RepID=A0A5N6SDR8_ASPPS|nr:uncharacterized protein BDV38DRAFT_260411 [Aspergillus pseudotamarii]KAE8132765.1 hypothetical protein BDV38DRAFT_260411 [Aspergillus pseudotamarii]
MGIKEPSTQASLQVPLMVASFRNVCLANFLIQGFTLMEILLFFLYVLCGNSPRLFDKDRLPLAGNQVR